ncbi:FMN-linked oxidoreductase [Neoconidiobolus thromboides FSU 785]|nr:FMN-linked oxidoreductase [Neoconidiobolus thromboides FSU 785]
MVRYSKLPFRQLLQDYNLDLVYTPMILSDVFSSSSLARDSDFTTTSNESPLAVQLAAKNSKEAGDASEFLANYCDVIDINCGCPQKWAINEGIGGYLMSQPEIVREIVREVKNRSGMQCSIKIRVHKELSKTIEMVKRAESVGVAWITVHGRTVKQSSSEEVNYEAIKMVKEHATVPVFGNGNIFSLADADKMVENTKVDGVMSARGILNNPALFTNAPYTPMECVEKYVHKALEQGTNTFIFHHHLMYMLESTMSKAEKKSFNVLSSIPAILDHLEEHYGLECME